MASTACCSPSAIPRGLVPLTHERVRGISHLGGTILGTTNKGDPFHFPTRQPDGSMGESDRPMTCWPVLRARVSMPWYRSVGTARCPLPMNCTATGLRVVGAQDHRQRSGQNLTTFGFDTAVTFATECLDRLHSTAESHQRIMVVEMMGRYAGWISLHAGIAGGRMPF